MAQSFRVLLVEDDDSLRGCLAEFLASQGWDVRATGFAKEALHMMQRQRFDFSLLDFHLPGMTGLELFQRIALMRQVSSMVPLPAILMSGMASAEEAAAAHHAGFFAFLRKPLDLLRLRLSLHLLIQTHFGGPIVPHTALPHTALPHTALPHTAAAKHPPSPPKQPGH